MENIQTDVRVYMMLYDGTHIMFYSCDRDVCTCISGQLADRKIKYRIDLIDVSNQLQLVWNHPIRKRS